MSDKPYYLAYEARYQAVYAAGAQRWGHAPEDAALAETLTRWVAQHQLRGKRVVEFACGEGASGVILSQLGCVYHGVDIAPSAVEKARAALAPFPMATAARMDMVNESLTETFDAALDVMGFHMLVVDGDCARYLAHAHAALKPGAPMLFYQESYRRTAYEGTVGSYAEWLALTGDDYATPQLRRVLGTDTEVRIPLVPARARSRDGYVKTLVQAGFSVDDFQEMGVSEQILSSATIWTHKR